MKKIINVVNLSSNEDVNRLREHLSETRLNFEVSLEHQAVIVYGGSDEVRVAVHEIRKAGFEVL